MAWNNPDLSVHAFECTLNTKHVPLQLRRRLVASSGAREHSTKKRDVPSGRMEKKEESNTELGVEVLV